MGTSGGSIGFVGPEAEITIARLCRIGGKYFMQLGKGNLIDISKYNFKFKKWGTNIKFELPTTYIDLGIKSENFIKVAASNHYLLTTGDHTKEVIYAAHAAKLPVVRIDNDVKIEEWLDSIRYDNFNNWCK